MPTAGSGLPLSVFVRTSLSSRPSVILSSLLRPLSFSFVSALFPASSSPAALFLLVSLWILVPPLISSLSARLPPSCG
jgi:hypothetical protein